VNSSPADDGELDRFARSLAGELHDGVVQWIVGAKMQAEAVRARLIAGHSIAPEAADLLVDTLQQALREARLLMQGLHTPELSSGHWHAALQEDISRCSSLIRQNEAQLTWQLEANTDPLPEPVAHTAFRLAREAIWNALRHAKATQIQIRASRQEDQLVIEISDDGKGFDPAAIPKDRFGVRGLQRRAQEHSGTAIISSAPGKGTTCHFTLPLPKRKRGQEPFS
jgi:signal transduction histidine kinase